MKPVAGVLAVIMLAAWTVACGTTDVGITTAIKTKFAADDVVKAYEIDVTTQDRVVTLEGEVETLAAKERASELALASDGVREVNNLLVVRVNTTSDADDLGDQLEKGVDATTDAVQKAGRTIRDAVTDRDQDTDKDGH